ncbi:MAG: hypothetical protein V7K97_24120 [Nostoc sp.]|uniref:hypothetical protein n=1 Tax=Nostoc sp. TaxID=1180 RepID=UPI002FF7F784
MILHRGRKVVAALLLSVVILTTACSPTPKTPGRFDQVQKESTQQKKGLAVAKTATQGSEFNKFFPDAGDGYQRVYTQEKKGFSEAKLKKGGQDLALLSISDTTGTDAAAKFSNSTKKIGGYPAVEVGKTQTAILVGGKYQVKALSRNPSFKASDRADWLQKFNLDGLSKLK